MHTCMDNFFVKDKIRNLLDNHLWYYKQNCDFCKAVIKDAEQKLSHKCIENYSLTETNDGYVYLGDISNGQREGYGFEYNEEGVLYMGEWHENKYHGRGYLFSGNQCFCGVFKNSSYCDNNIITGVGIHMWSNKRIDEHY